MGRRTILHRVAIAAVLATTLLAASRAAFAQTPGDARDANEASTTNEENHALATALFRDARKLMEEGKVEGACRKFEESERLDPGGGTLLNLAACHEREGRTASAWTEFSAALSQARKDGRADRLAVATERVAALEPRLARLTIVVASGADRPDLEVSLDGVPVRRPAWGVAVPVDPGEHVAEAHAAGFDAWRGAIVIGGDGEAKTIEIPALEPAPIVASVPIATPAPVPTQPTIATPPSRLPRDLVTIGAAAVGVAGVVLGAHFGLRAISLQKTAEAACPAGRCTDDAVTTSDRATTSADLSTATFAIGAAGLGAAAVLFLTRGHATSSPISAMVTPSSAALIVTGRF